MDINTILREAHIVVPHSDDEAMRIDYIDKGVVYLSGEQSGEQYIMSINDFNTEEFMFYQLKLIEVE